MALRARRCLPVIVLAVAFIATPARGADAKDGCGLLTTPELEAVLGGKLSPWAGGDVPSKNGAKVRMCTAHTPKADVLLRVVKSKEKPSANAAAQGLEVMKQMGATVEIKTFGPITCSTVTPPKSMEQYGFNTTCSVVKNKSVAAVEITVKARKDVVPIEKLHPLADKIATRME